MICVLKTLVQAVLLLATVMSPVAVSAIQIASDFDSVPDAPEDEFVPEDSDDAQQSAPDLPHASIQPAASDPIVPKVPVLQAESVAESAAAAKSFGNPALPRPVGASRTRISLAGMSFSSPAKWHKKSPVSFMSNSPTVSFGSGSSSCCDVAGGGDISRLMVFAQPRPFASAVEVGSPQQFTDSSAGFSQSLAASGGQSARAQSGARRPAAKRSSAQLATASSGACGCVGSVCGGESESSGGLITAVARMIKTFANCLIFSE